MGRKQFQTLPHLAADVARLVDDFEKETDRGVALLGAAFLDDVLDVMLRAAFVEDAEAVSRILGPGRPLESFGARAHLAYCIGLLSRDIYHDVNLIREVRNDFAHRQPTSFEAPDIWRKCQQLLCVTILIPEGGCTWRERFIVDVVLIANHLMAAAEAEQHSTPPEDFTRNGILRLK